MKQKYSIKTIFIYILVGLLLFIGLGFLSYPTISNLYHHIKTNAIVQSYEENINNSNDEYINKLFKEAKEYNNELKTMNYHWYTDEETWKRYSSVLDVTGTGIMCYLEVPKINVKLPVYHGTSEGVLAVGLGHMEGSSLPIGGNGEHAIISGHRGMPSAQLLTDIVELELGDIFYINILGEKHIYQVDHIEIVLPTELDILEPIENKDYISLTTCTPYAVNTHRYVVRGIRIEEKDELFNLDNTTDTYKINDILIVVCHIIGIIAVIGCVLSLKKKEKK